MKVGAMEIIAVIPSDVTVEWTSSNPGVATVKDGVVSAVGVGYSSVRATAGKDYAECQVYVTGTKGETLSITPSIVSMKKGETYQYVYTTTYDVPLTWTSSNTEVATIDENGLVTALKAGNTFITLSNGLEEVHSTVTSLGVTSIISISPTFIWRELADNERLFTSGVLHAIIATAATISTINFLIVLIICFERSRGDQTPACKIG